VHTKADDFCRIAVVRSHIRRKTQTGKCFMRSG
jgi:hypothetical protein